MTPAEIKKARIYAVSRASRWAILFIVGALIMICGDAPQWAVVLGGWVLMSMDDGRKGR